MKKLAKLKAPSPSENCEMETVKQSPITETVFDLDTMDEVVLFKPVPDFTPVETSAAALERLGGDAAKFLAVLNKGLQSEERNAIRSNGDVPWMVESEDEGTEPTKFSGTPADTTIVNPLILNLAKTVFGYSKKMKPEEKKAAKESAKDLIKSTDRIKSGLQETARKAAAEAAPKADV